MSERKAIVLRLNRKLWEELTHWAEEELRSLNGQIEYILADALNKRNKTRKNN